MYQTIGEDIVVTGVFRGGQFTPKRFEWARKIYTIQEITMKITVKEYGESSLMYSCVIKPLDTVARLSFNLKNLHWKIEEIWQDG